MGIYVVFHNRSQKPGLDSMVVYDSKESGKVAPPYIPGVRKLYTTIISVGIRKSRVNQIIPGREIINPVLFL
jgi:hypothetical protein